MRLSTITNLAYAVTLILTTVSATTFILSARNASQERTAIEDHLILDDLAEEIAIIADDAYRGSAALRHARRRATSGQILRRGDQENHLENGPGQTRQARCFASGGGLFATIRKDADALDSKERDAIGQYRSGRQADAQQILFGDDHYQLHTGLLRALQTSEKQCRHARRQRFDEAKSRSDFYGSIAKVMLALTALMFLAVLYFVLSRRVAAPLNQDEQTSSCVLPDRITASMCPTKGVVTRLAR